VDLRLDKDCVTIWAGLIWVMALVNVRFPSFTLSQAEFSSILSNRFYAFNLLDFNHKDLKCWELHTLLKIFRFLFLP
jgi:hypothetical protein